MKRKGNSMSTTVVDTALKADKPKRLRPEDLGLKRIPKKTKRAGERSSIKPSKPAGLFSAPPDKPPRKPLSSFGHMKK